jgi:glucose/arabinose dehydrogenase
MAVTPTNDVLMFDFNGCHITRVKPGGDTKVLVGSTTGNECSFGALRQDRVGQGQGLALDAKGRILFADKQNHRILRITIAADDSASIVALYEDEAIAPTDIAVAPDGAIFFVDSTTKSVWKLE